MRFIIQRVVEEPGRLAATATTASFGGFSGDAVRIGRGTNADLRFDDAAVALEHAVIQVEGSELRLVDRGSVTGTYVNGKRVEEARLESGDVIEVGSHRIRLRMLGAGGPLMLTIEAVAPREEPAAAEPLQAPRVDYARAYSLERGLWNKATLGLGLGAAALVLVAAIPLLGKRTLLRPGPIAQGHARILGAADCGACHRPWRGPANEACARCHKEPQHQLRQVFTPACEECHAEHRGLARLTDVDDHQCVTCHGDLAVRHGQPTLFARRITGFAVDHPEFAVSVEDEDGARRLRLEDPAARRADPGRLFLNHQLHLAPDLLGPEGRMQLACSDCHRLAEDGDVEPVSYDLHCQSCHRLDFDDRLPPAPHAAADQVYAFIVTAYTGRVEELTAVSPEEMRSRIFRRGVQTLELSERVERLVFAAADQVYRNRCQKCHEMDLSAWPGRPPAVEPIRLPSTWYVHARFSHKPHRGIDCATCHEGAADSRQTADLLLPSIATCRPCHGGGQALEGEAAESRCATCHDYHDRARMHLADDWGGELDLIDVRK